MNTRKLTGFFFCSVMSCLLLANAANAQSIAITEFINNPDGEDDGREWVEFYNYGASPVDLSGFTLSDEDSDSYVFGAVSIAPQDFLILVNSGGVPSDAAAKAVFEQGWLGGVADPRVVGADFGGLANSSDELILSDASTNVLWSLAYSNDEDEDSTALTDLTFGTTAFGDKATPGIVREGDDNGTVGFLGYEDSGDYSSVFFEDADAIKGSAFLTGLGIATDFYDNVDASSTEGDPFALTVPEPSTILLGCVAAAGLFSRRRR